MTDTILQTKLYTPPTRPNLVPRPHLIKQLNQGLQQGCKLTLISAPAGFGKTTLIAEWGMRIAESTNPNSEIQNLKLCWLSLDESDNDPTRFLSYSIAALQTIDANIAKGALSTLQSPQPPPTEAILTSLINEIATLPDNPSTGSGQSFVLVLDDYHVIDAKPVDNALTFLLEHLPPQMHLVISTRDDPNLPLARLRARGQLTELRAADLRFTSAEVTEFLNQVMNLSLSAEDIVALETRTEGWIVGLQLAAISMQGHQDAGHNDVGGFIQSFTGSHRFVLDYLVEEVLQRQPEHVRSFLLQTSILDRLRGPLCDVVTGEEDGRRMLETLERGNLFVIPLDDKRQWYRYHHLFADVLHAHLMEEQPNQAPTLHQRASEWCEQNGLLSDAVSHALAAEELERAAGLIELARPTMERSYIQSATWLGWVKALPDDLVRARPVLSVGYAWALMDTGELEASQARLRDAERWLDTAAEMSERPEDPSANTCPERSRRMVVVDEEQFLSLPASIAIAHAYHAQALGDAPGSVKHGRRALDLLLEGEHLRRGQATTLLGLAYWASGDLEAAHRSFVDFMAIMRVAGNIPEIISGAFVLADIRVALGRLHEALSTYQRSLQFAASHGEPMPPGTEDLYRGISELHRERGDLEAAAQQLLTSKKLGEQAAQPDWQRRLCVAQARIMESQGDLDGTLDLLDEAERLSIRTPLPDVRPIAALKTRVWVAQGRLAEALGWVRERDLSANDDLSYLREFEHITLARVLIAQYKNDRVDGSIHEAIGLLERLLKAAEEGGRMGSVIEIMVLQALAHQAQGNIPAALVPLERALVLAEPEGYVRIFVDEGPPMAALLRETAKHGAAPDYVRQLRAAFEKAEGGTPVTQLLVDPLSERELEVLRLLGTELNGPEIARELMVSLNTMRTHTKNIYSKLGVHNRRAAARRAEELDL